MVWTNWQGATWRGAILVILFWSGLAWTQTPAQRPADPTERIMAVHENGKTRRCRVLETWQLADGRVAHLLQALESGEKITIVDDQAPTGVQRTYLADHPRAMPKRIFSWGLGRNTPPEGSPIPPHFHSDTTTTSGIVQMSGPVIVNRADEQAQGGPCGPPCVIEQPGVLQRPNLFNRLFGKKEAPPADAQLVTFPQGTPSGAPIMQVGQVPCCNEPLPTTGPKTFATDVVPSGNAPTVGDLPVIPTLNPLENTEPKTINAGNPTPGVIPQLIPTGAGPASASDSLPPIPSVMPSLAPANPPASSQYVSPAAPTPNEVAPLPGVLPAVDPNQANRTMPAEPDVRRPWRPGDRIAEWFGSRSPANTVKTESVTLPPPPAPITPPLAIDQPPTPTLTPTPAPIPTPTLTPTPTPTPTPTLPQPTPGGSLVSDPKIVLDKAPAPEPAVKQPWRPGQKIWQWFTGKSTTDVAKAEPMKSIETKKIDAKPVEPLKLETKPAELKVAEVKLEDVKKIDKTESNLIPDNTPPAPKQLDATVKTPDAPFSTAMPTPLPAVPEPELKKVEAPPLAPATPSVSLPAPKEAQPPVLPPTPGEVKPAGAPAVEKHDLWGPGSGNSVPPSGKSLLEGNAKSAEVAQLPPPSLVRHNDPLMMPERLNPGEDRSKPKMMAPPPPTPEVSPPPPIPGPMSSNNWPLGSQSVLAARNGLQGPVTYVPIPIVTQPAPNRAPTPPMPTGLEAPRLNAYVNAFSPPPQPPGTQQYPAQGMMPPGAMNPYLNPMMAQQMMQQQMMQQQMMMQQQAMYANGYPPNMNPLASQGPAMNFARGYTGPQAPNPVGGNAMMPAVYPPMMPQQPIMPISYQQPAPYQQPMPMPMQPQMSPAALQVQQLIKVLRESPYPATREWAGQQLASFDWRVHPQVVPMLIQSATQDQAASVRAGCVYSLSRAQAAVEPVFTMLHNLRNDIDPRVRQEAEQAFVRLSQTQQP